MKKIIKLLPILVLIGCASQTATPLGHNLVQIDVSAAPVYGRAGAQKMAIKKAAQTTLDYGFDRFIVMNTSAWNEMQASGGSHGSFSATQNFANGSHSEFWGVQRAPETSMIIKMFKNKDKGASSAVDARSVLGAN